jgi:hypothetical protein
MRTSFFVGSCALLSVSAGLAFTSVTSSCAPGLTGGAGGTGGTGGAGGLMPGEICTDPTGTPGVLNAHMMPGVVFVPPCPKGQGGCTTRQVTLVVNPDTCHRSAVHFETSDASIAPAPADTAVDLHNDAVAVSVQGGGKPGKATITAHVHVAGDKGKTVEVTATLQVETIAETPSCKATDMSSTPLLKGGDTLSLGAASIALPKGADNPNQNSFIWSVTPFPATIACGVDMTVPGTVALGPAITFGPETSTFQREIPLQIPVNPALLPSAARLRHVRVAYSGPAFKAPRTIPAADVHLIEDKASGGWALGFKAPRLGTYQAVVPVDAGTKKQKRLLTHRAVMGVSMGGGGTATFGMRHHDLFDVLAPLGGPVSWTFLLDYIEKNHLGGFRPIPKGTTLNQIQLASTPCTTGADCKSDETCIGAIASPATPGKCLLMPKVTDPYAHPQTFNTWWYEYPRAGNGGTFDRRSYAQIFRDLALMYGNPNGDNLSPGGENLPAGVPPTDPTVVGDHPGSQCAVWVDPLDCPPGADGTIPDSCPEKDQQRELDNNCPKERCSHTLTLQNYFDDEYNPDGIFPVITVCDGSSQNSALTPYANTWTPQGDDYPLEVGLAVDYNGNGVRDELEPIIRAGHEPWRDDGEDGTPSSQEAGYSPGVNDDPVGDDYNAQYNPSGTEGDHRFQAGEHYDDFGLDGVASTKQQPAGGWQNPGDGYDVGEGDGKFTVSRGLQRFWDRDAHSIARRMVDPAKVPGGDLTDQALSRLDIWTDGGTRDLFNFAVDAQHLAGAFYARGRDVTYLTSFTQQPGLDPASPPNAYDGKLVDFDDLPGVVLQRYGALDPSATDIDNGSGQHVGTASEILARLESALYFVSRRWRDRPELYVRVDTSLPDVSGCEEGSKTITFPADGAALGTSKRRGPVGVSLPPGYCKKDMQGIRYPVIYLLHGYGQGPQDLEPTIVLLQNFMNDSLRSGATRLVKAIIVYVDGRCRTNPDGSAECLRGTFFADSVRKTGAQDEQWWLELIDHVDQHYRTLGTGEVDWTQ